MQRISIHAAREGGDNLFSVAMGKYAISIHAAREGGDDMLADSFDKALEFQSTPPVKAATIRKLTNSVCCQISIHAAREGGDA